MSDYPVILVSEAECERLVDAHSAFDAVSEVFGRMASGSASNFPVVREAIGHANALYGFKSGFDRDACVLGVKSGGYWPGNMEQGLTNHQSVICLFDPDTGRLHALVGGNYLTAVRTAASAAISINCLARPDARILGIIGAGHQAPFQLRAAAAQREFEKIVGWNLHPEHLSRLQQVADEAGLPFEALSAQGVCASADVIITITSSFEALLKKQWIRPGTHLACMGTDTRGKQEVEAELVASASVFTDEVAQSISIGEAQHAFEAGTLAADRITVIGEVINGTHPGRTSSEEVTLFDGTGVGLQDLAVAAVAADKAKAAGSASIAEL